MIVEVGLYYRSEYIFITIYLIKINYQYAQANKQDGFFLHWKKALPPMLNQFDNWILSVL